MADNPRKKGADRKRVSQQKHEQDYQRRRGANERREDSHVPRIGSRGRSGTEGSENRSGESRH